MKKIIGILLFGALLTATSCLRKRDFDFKRLTIEDWKPDWALPLINSTLTLKNIVQTGTVVSEDANGLYSLHYAGDVFSGRVADYVFIQNQSFSSGNINLSLPQSLPSFSGSFTDSFSNHFTYSDTSGAQLAHIHVKSGSLNFSINSTFAHSINATIIFPDVRKDGIPLQLTASIAPSGTGNTSVSLAGYVFDLTNGGAAKNYIAYKIRYTLAGSGQPLAPSNSISASISTQDIQYSFIDGFLGSYTIPIPHDTIYIGVFDNTLSANIFIRNPQIHLTFRNSVGLGVSAQFDELFGRTNNGVKVNMTYPPVNVAGAVVPGETTVSKTTIDSTNSIVQNIFNPAPNEVIYAGKIRINPGGSTPVYSFVTDSSRVSLEAVAELPAWFRIIEFSLQDTVALLLPEDSSLVNSAEFKLLMDNALPLYGNVQLYFADENYNFIDSLIPTVDDVLGQAPVDANGQVNGRKQAITNFVMSREEYNRMAPRVRYAVMRGQLKSSGAGDVKIQSSNNLILKLAFRFTLNVSSTDL
jgi:hypothetical protein